MSVSVSHNKKSVKIFCARRKTVSQKYAWTVKKYLFVRERQIKGFHKGDNDDREEYME